MFNDCKIVLKKKWRYKSICYNIKRLHYHYEIIDNYHKDPQVSFNAINTYFSTIEEHLVRYYVVESNIHFSD